jgi:hypothetical protein
MFEIKISNRQSLGIAIHNRQSFLFHFYPQTFFFNYSPYMPKLILTNLLRFDKES